MPTSITEKKVSMQIMTFPLSREIDLGIRMTEIRRIEAFKEHSDPQEGQVYFPQQWFTMPIPDGLIGMKGVSLSSYREAMIVVPRIGRILRLLDSSDPIKVHQEFSFLSRYRTLEGTEAWVLDVPKLRLEYKGEPDLPPQGHPSSGESEGLFQQVGQTARDIQRVLSLSASMVDSLRFMEGKLPETSHGLGVISQMTEEAAHKLMNILESILEDHAGIRTLLQSASGNEADIAKIGAILDRSDEKVMHGFEAMAFQDLVGQNIKLIGGHLKELESRLVRILIEGSAETEQKAAGQANSSGLSQNLPGQSLKGVGAQGDIDQNAVDQLLSEFGF